MRTQELRAEARGRIINLGSQQGIVTAPRDTPYGVSKAGAIYLTRQVVVDYAGDLIVCNSVSPGKIVTGKPGLPMDPALLENARRRTPWPRPGRPQGCVRRGGVPGKRPRQLHYRHELGS